jgi:hypothetical protein
VKCVWWRRYEGEISDQGIKESGGKWVLWRETIAYRDLPDLVTALGTLNKERLLDLFQRKVKNLQLYHASVEQELQLCDGVLWDPLSCAQVSALYPLELYRK